MTDTDDVKKVVNFTMVFDQQKQFFVRRIEFSGNTTTRDKVIRREILLDEGQVYNNRLWELSILRLNQLGYFDTIKPENAELKRNVKAGTVDIHLKVKEKGKQSISFSGGVSGISGSFVGLSYQTNNFLGLGETLTFSVQFGNIQRSIQFGFTEPYLIRPAALDRVHHFPEPIRLQHGAAGRDPAGPAGGDQSGAAGKLQHRFEGLHDFRELPAAEALVHAAGTDLWMDHNEHQAFQPVGDVAVRTNEIHEPGGPIGAQWNPFEQDHADISYNTVNSPVNPTHGKSFYYGFSLEGGPLQGNIDTIGNTFSMSYFHPHYHRRNTIAMKFQTAMITGYGGKDVPPYNRFYLGGEQDVRGYDFYTISPFVVIPFSTTTNISFLNPKTASTQQGVPTRDAARERAGVYSDAARRRLASAC